MAITVSRSRSRAFYFVKVSHIFTASSFQPTDTFALFTERERERRVKGGQAAISMHSIKIKSRQHQGEDDNKRIKNW
jgi:hypothetical protein